MSSLIGTMQATRRMQNLETLHYYALHTLIPLLGCLDDKHSEFLKLWIANQGFREFPNLIQYYTTMVNGTIVKE